MKRGFRKSLALLLAVFMAFGVVPFIAVGMVASAADPELASISMSMETLEMQEGDKAQLSVIAFYTNNTHKVLSNGVRWSTTDNKLVDVSSTGEVKAIKATEKDKPVTIYANYTEDGIAKETSCAVTVLPKPVPVDSIDWNWDATALLAESGKVYSFAYTVGATDNLYKIVPDNAAVKTATLSCTPEGALQIDNNAKTFKVNPIKDEKLVITLKLTADDPSDKCQPATKQVTIYKDVPITGVAWRFRTSAGAVIKEPLYNYYDKDSNTNEIAEYYYMPTELGDPKADYRFETVPASADYLKLCEVSVSSADKRIVQFDEKTGRIIPVGNGETTVTVTLKTPKGKTYKDTAKVHVQNSPYTPVTTASIIYEEADSDAYYEPDKNTIYLIYAHEIQLAPVLNNGAKLDQKAITIMIGDTKKKLVNEIEYSWSSSDEEVAVVDQTGHVTITGEGTATITLTINDNGTTVTKSVNVAGKIPTWVAIAGIFMSFFSGRWDKIGTYFRALFAGLFGG